jgi:hypothetical protein
MGDIRRVTLPLGEEPAVRVESTIPPPLVYLVADIRKALES